MNRLEGQIDKSEFVLSGEKISFKICEFLQKTDNINVLYSKTPSVKGLTLRLLIPHIRSFLSKERAGGRVLGLVTEVIIIHKFMCGKIEQFFKI